MNSPSMTSQSLTEKFALIHEHWRHKVVAKLNGQEVKLAKLCGVFPWHHHEHEDEMFLVWRGRMKIEFREHVVELGAGEFCVVPRGTEHRTMADNEVEVSYLNRRKLGIRATSWTVKTTESNKGTAADCLRGMSVARLLSLAVTTRLS